MTQRERWASRIGLVLAMAGNAVGLGNFLRFPGQVASNGGGAFMIPYFVCFLLMGIPLMWLEWGMGRYGGTRGHGSTPGMFHVMWRSPVAKYLGVLGLFIPSVILFYYSYIASWTLGFAVLSAVGQMPEVPQQLDTSRSPDQIKQEVLQPFDSFLKEYVGEEDRAGSAASLLLRPRVFAYILFWVVVALNFWVLARGVAHGIELLAKVAMPLLFVLAIVLVIRVLTLGQVVPGGQTPVDGLNFIWEPQWFVERGDRKVFVLLDPQTWLAAAGQIFFTLSLGMGAIQCYASYLREDDDVMLTGLSTTSANEFCEVVLGSSIAIPAAVAFFGIVATKEIAAGGSFYLGFTSMPAIFSYIHYGQFLAALWFLLLFFAAFTSTVAMAQPFLAFLQDEFHIPRQNAVGILVGLWVIGAHVCIFVRHAWQVMDYWSGTLGPPLMALVEVILVMWIFGGKRMWEEMHKGAELRAPRFFYYASRYITPLILIAIFAGMVYQQITGANSEKGLEGMPAGSVGVWIARGTLVLFLGLLLWLIYWAFNGEHRNRAESEARQPEVT